jgi:5,10-methenyltetrahydrofolate synthetase
MKFLAFIFNQNAFVCLMAYWHPFCEQERWWLRTPRDDAGVDAMAGTNGSGLGEGLEEFSSPACSMPAFTVNDPASSATAEPMSRAEVLAWRKSERERLMAERLAVPAADRQDRATRIAAHLDRLLPDLTGTIVSLYWPIRGEPDLRAWAKSIELRGGRCALPVVVEKATPLAFREWQTGAPLVRGFWNIPVPADGAEVRPDVTLAPVIGFDTNGYRLGYGGGYFDRTLAALAPRPKVIAVGYGIAAIQTIHPLAHDIAMDAVVTENGTVWTAAR